MTVLALTLDGGSRVARLAPLRSLAFIAATLAGASALPAYAEGLSSTPATPGTPPTPRRLSLSEIEALERAGGESGIDCSIERRTMGVVFAYRKDNTPTDSAEEYMYNRENSVRLNQFMMDTVREIYKDPAAMSTSIATGEWTKKCIQAIRGF